MAGYTIAVLRRSTNTVNCHIAHIESLVVLFQTRLAYILSNGIGAIKVLTLVFIAITGWVVLGGHTSAHTTNFDDSFASTSATPYGLTNALYKIVFSYAGFENAFNVVNETRNPVKRIRTCGFISIFVVAVLYILANVAYFAAGELRASLVFRLVTLVSSEENASKFKPGSGRSLFPDCFRQRSRGQGPEYPDCVERFRQLGCRSDRTIEAYPRVWPVSYQILKL